MNYGDIAIQANPSLLVNKNVDLIYATIGDTLNYSISISNTGETDAYNVILTDLIPQGANFITNSVNVNGFTQNGVNPSLGINVPTIAVGTTATVTMQVVVVTLPWTITLSNQGQIDYQYTDITTTPNVVTALINTNNVVTTINTPLMYFTKSSSVNTVSAIGQTLTYYLYLANLGDVTANNINIVDTIPSGTTFIPGSIEIFGTTLPGTVAPPTGISIGDLWAGYYTSLSFKVTVVSIPITNVISNFSDVSFDYVVDPLTTRIVNSRVTSNILDLNVNILSANLTGITKGVNKAFATKGDILTYVVTVPNSGNATAVNVVLVDTIPVGTTYVDNSMIIRGVPSLDTPLSINIGTIAAGQLITLQFKVKVN